MYLSVIVCCYRGEETIKKCINSLLNQSYPNNQYEIIIINDGAIDNSLKIIKDQINNHGIGEPKILLVDKKNEGLSIARNEGLNIAKGEVVIYIDEDAVAKSNYLEEISNGFASNISANCVGGVVDLLNPNDRFASLLHYSVFNWYMTSKSAIIGTNMAFTKELLESTNGFIPEFTRRGDETALMAKVGKRLVKFISNQATVYHMQPDSIGEWLKTRKENGFFSAVIDKLIKKDMNLFLFYARFVFKLLHLLLFPLIVFASPFISHHVIIVLLSIYAIMLIKRYLYSNLIMGPMKMLIRNKYRENKVWEYFILSPLIILGCIYSDYGFIKASLMLIGNKDIMMSLKNVKI